MSMTDQILSNGSSLAEIIMAVLAIVSAIIAYISYIDSKKRRKREKAVELAKYYADNIIGAETYINFAISDSDFFKISKECFEYDAIEKFNNNEMLKLLKRHNEEYDVKYLGKKFDEIPVENLIKATLLIQNYNPLNEKTFWLIDSFGEDVSETKKKHVELNVRLELSDKINDLLNSLEWFSMNLITGVADEETIYQSLHQTYLAVVQELYFFIAKRNTEEHNKYFTNTIKLFKIWAAREHEMKTKESLLGNKYEEKKNKLVRNQKSI